jgi:hypothetical protein
MATQIWIQVDLAYLSLVNFSVVGTEDDTGNSNSAAATAVLSSDMC